MSNHVMFILCSVTVLASLTTGARILGVFPTPSISHQVVFRKITTELARRGHQIVMLTPDPLPSTYDKRNITEIDFHDISYEFWAEKFLKSIKGVAYNPVTVTEVLYKLFAEVFELQMNSEAGKKFLADKTQNFDLILYEPLIRACLGFTQIYNVPVIAISSLYPTIEFEDLMGIASHPTLSPQLLSLNLNNLTLQQKAYEIYLSQVTRGIVRNNEVLENRIVKSVFGNDCPTVDELVKRVDMGFVNVNPIFDNNKPVPPNVIYMGGIHMEPVKKLPKDLQSYLDSSKNGVIYMSFGTNMLPSQLPSVIRKIFVNVLSSLPYNVITKWDGDDFDQVKNIKAGKWFPQNDLLRHPNMKLFITQAGLQSTDEAIAAHVPLLAIPVFGDQFYNANQYIKLGIGKKLQFDTLTEESLKNTILEIIQNESYRNNIAKLDELVKDQPQTPLERAVWWTEYVLRHKGAKHLRSPQANITYFEYFVLDLVIVVLIGLIIALYIFIKLYKTVLELLCGGSKKNKRD